jgi:hypothetical protein
LDAPKTGVEVVIPHQYKCNLRSQLPPWHSRKVKEEARAVALGRRNNSSSQQQLGSFRQCSSRVCRWVVVQYKVCGIRLQKCAASLLVIFCTTNTCARQRKNKLCLLEADAHRTEPKLMP